MAARQYRQSSFIGGEISPELYSRSDIERFGQSVRRCRNFIVTPEGALTNALRQTLARS